jgi:hypothetical protein
MKNDKKRDGEKWKKGIRRNKEMRWKKRKGSIMKVKVRNILQIALVQKVHSLISKKGQERRTK